MNDKKEKLTGIVGKGNVLDDPETLRAYSRDQSFVAPMKPWFVVKPKNVDEVQEIVMWANETQTPLVPVSSGPPHFHGDTVPSAPGAVMVGGMADRKTIGRTSIAGPLTNITLALVFLVFTQVLQGPIVFVFDFGVMINSFIALFNLIPFGVLDGFKVFFWNKGVWGIVFSVSLALTVYSFVYLPL